MANWLDKALGRKSETTSVAVVPFEVRCECGSRLTGIRSDRARRSICAQCGEAHFILPVNKYPESERAYFDQTGEDGDPSDSDQAAVEDQTERKSASIDAYSLDPENHSASDADVDLGLDFELDEPEAGELQELSADDDSDDLLDFLDEPPEPRDESRKRRDSLYEASASEQQIPSGRRSVPDAPKQRESSRARHRKSRSSSVPSGMIEVRRTESGWGETRKRVVLVVSGIAVLALGMALWAIRSQTVDHAEARLAVAKDAGLDAFEVGNFAEAREQLKIALDALEVVGADEDQIAPIRRRWLEAEFATHLLDGSLIDIVEATRDAQSLDRDEWSKQFDVRFAGRWLLLDLSPIERVTYDFKDEDGEVESTETRIVYPWTIDDRVIQVAGVGSLVRGDRERVILAGRLTGSEFDSDAQAWVVQIDEDDSFLWTDFSALVELGFVAEEEDEGLRQVLRDQQSEGGTSTGTLDSELAEAASGVETEETEEP